MVPENARGNSKGNPMSRQFRIVIDIEAVPVPISKFRSFVKPLIRAQRFSENDTGSWCFDSLEQFNEFIKSVVEADFETLKEKL
jgi:hypothetical protein